MFKKTFSIWFFIAFSHLAFAQLRKIEIYYDINKTLPKETYHVDKIHPSILEGDYTNFYPNGKVKSKGNFEKNQQAGIWEYYYDNGNPKMTGMMDKNQRTGLWKYYHENGKISSAGNLKNGIREGQWKYFYENEEIKSEGAFVKGKKNGLWQYYFEDGIPKAQAEYINDKGLYKEYDTKGKLTMEGWIINGQSDSTWKYYYDLGLIKATGTEKNGLRNGYWMLFHPNGKLAAEGNYKDGVADGKWIYYHENGVKSAEGVEKKGQKEGAWKLYYPTGSFKAEGEFASGSGIYKEFYESGKLKVQGFIQKGVNQGLWKYYYEDGTLEGEADFKDGEGLFKGYYADGKPKIQGFIKNGKRVGTWEIFKPDGTTGGLIKHYHDESDSNQLDLGNIQDDKIDSVLSIKSNNDIVITKAQPVVKNKGKKKIKKNSSDGLLYKHFKPRINEFRSFIISANPGGLFFNQLPVSIEYYMRERLGYELKFTLYNDPFFKSHTSLPLNKIFLKGFSVDLRQKFYSRDHELGMVYFAQEIRFTSLDHSADVYDDVLEIERIITSKEKKYEYSILVGNRWMQHSGTKGFTFDIFGGIGAGYRSYKQNFPDNMKYNVIFQDVKKNSFVVSPRIGFSFGYVF